MFSDIWTWRWLPSHDSFAVRPYPTSHWSHLCAPVILHPNVEQCKEQAEIKKSNENHVQVFFSICLHSVNYTLIMSELFLKYYYNPYNHYAISYNQYTYTNTYIIHTAFSVDLFVWSSLIYFFSTFYLHCFNLLFQFDPTSLGGVPIP